MEQSPENPRMYHNKLRRYSIEEFKATFKVGDRVRMVTLTKDEEVRITAIGENRVMYRSVPNISPEKLIYIVPTLWALAEGFKTIDEL